MHMWFPHCLRRSLVFVDALLNGLRIYENRKESMIQNKGKEEIIRSVVTSTNFLPTHATLSLVLFDEKKKQ